MRRLPALALSLCLAAPLAGQTAEEVEAARLAYEDGHHALALTVLIPAAEAGDPEAQNLYGIALRRGEGVAKDPAAAFGWYEKAIAGGSLKALHNLAHLLAEGDEGVPADHEKARALYEQVLEAGYREAANGLGILYERGLGMPSDPAKAAEYYAIGAEAEEKNALYNLANAYRTGAGVQEDMGKALELYTRAALAGHPGGWNALGLLFENGMGVAPDYEAAHVFFMKAVADGLALGGINAGHFVTSREGWWQDPVRGYGYCLWGVMNAAEEEKEGFITSCEPLVEYLSVEEEDAAKRFAESLPPGGS